MQFNPSDAKVRAKALSMFGLFSYNPSLKAGAIIVIRNYIGIYPGQLVICTRIIEGSLPVPGFCYGCWLAVW